VEHFIENLLHWPPWVAILVVFLLPALESSIFLGIIFPGEIAVFLGGVIASGQVSSTHVSLGVILAAAITGAVIGDQIGYLVGREWGEALLRKLPKRLLPDEHLEASRKAIRRLGAKAVIAGRWTAALRAFVPGLAGMSGMHYVRFAIANFVGGSLWATVVVLLGNAAGRNWHHVYNTLTKYSLYAAIAAVVAIVVFVLIRRNRKRRRRQMAESSTESDETSQFLAS
jgi:undecaprenyl-diphosphatase